MNATYELKIEPADISVEEQQRILRILEGNRRPHLVGTKGEDVEIPSALSELFLHVIRTMGREQALYLVPDDVAMTTQEAADFLGMSRPYLTRLLTAGNIPYRRVGTHRRIQFKDLLTYREARSKQRNAVLSEMTKELVDAGVYDRSIGAE